MSEMVERVARKLRRTRWERSGVSHENADSLPLLPCDLFDARAAIEEMRQPTWPMIDAGGERTGDDPGAIWRGMIDEALL
jgi:hypothetical protein